MEKREQDKEEGLVGDNTICTVVFFFFFLLFLYSALNSAAMKSLEYASCFIINFAKCAATSTLYITFIEAAHNADFSL